MSFTDILRRDYAAAGTLGVSLACAVPDGFQAVELSLIHTTAGDRYRLDVWERPVASANLNAAPILPEDVFLESVTAEPTGEQGMTANAYVAQAVDFLLPETVEASGGHEIVLLFTCFDSSGVPKQFKPHLAAVSGQPQRVNGWTRATATGAWTNIATNRAPKIALLAPRLPVPLRPPAQVNPMSPADREIFGWIQDTHGGMYQPDPLPGVAIPGRFPGTATTGNGLEKLLTGDPNATAWPASQMQLGVDFGRTSTLPAATSATAHPAWNAATGLVRLRDTTPASQQVVGNYDFASAGLDLSNGSQGRVTVRDCTLDGGGVKTYGIGQGSGGGGYDQSVLDVSRTEMSGNVADALFIREGTIDRCYIHSQQADAGRFADTRPKRVMRTLSRKLGMLSTAHADGWQMSGALVRDFISFGNTHYMPATGTTYDEGSFGTTACLNFSTDGVDYTGNSGHDLGSVNDLLIGGGNTVYVVANAGGLINGVILIGSWFSRPVPMGGDYCLYNTFYPGSTGNIGTTKNLLIHNARFIEDGSPVCRWDSAANAPGPDLNGLWEYDKQIAPPNFLLACRLLGYIDENNDPLVPVRTGFHVGNVV